MGEKEKWEELKVGSEAKICSVSFGTPMKKGFILNVYKIS